MTDYEIMIEEFEYYLNLMYPQGIKIFNKDKTFKRVSYPVYLKETDIVAYEHSLEEFKIIYNSKD